MLRQNSFNSALWGCYISACQDSCTLLEKIEQFFKKSSIPSKFSTNIIMLGDEPVLTWKSEFIKQKCFHFRMTFQSSSITTVFIQKSKYLIFKCICHFSCCVFDCDFIQWVQACSYQKK